MTTMLVLHSLELLERVRSIVLPARDDERGANLVEYAFLVGLIAVVCLLAVTFFGSQTSAKFSSNASSFP